MDDVVAELRERLQRRRINPSQDVLEDRLRSACLNGAGHLMVTGSDRAEIHATLSRVLDAVQPLSAIRTLAVDADPHATVDRVISAFDPEATRDNYLDRRTALLALLARAEQAEKSIFVVVDDADRATIEQLERLRNSLEVAPGAIERLRLVLIGDETLPRRLEVPAARALRTRIVATVSLDDGADLDASTMPRRKTAASYASTFAAAAAVAFCTAVYAMYFLGVITGGERRASAVRPPKIDAAPPSRAGMYAIRGDEMFLTSTLRIDAASTPRKKITAPPAARVAKPAAAGPAARPPPPTAPRPAKAADTSPSAGSSIDAFIKRFPAAR